jgi:flagellar motor protein MotB
VLASSPSGCGPSERRASDVRRELSAGGIDEARELAPDLVAAAYAAVDEAEAAERDADLEAAADHATRARLYAQAALAERERARAEHDRIEVEQEVLAQEERALRVEELAGRSAGTGTSGEALELAEQAHEAAREALASARRARPGPTPEEIAAAEEAAREADVRVVRLERGLGFELDGAFRGTTAQPAAGTQRAIERLAALLAAHPHGPIAIEIDVPGMGESATRLARQRGVWARTALVAAGVPAERVAWREPGTTMPSSDAGDRLRVVLVAYVDPPAPPTPPVSSVPAQAPPVARP